MPRIDFRPLLDPQAPTGARVLRRMRPVREFVVLFMAGMVLSGYAGLVFLVLAIERGKPLSAPIGVLFLVLAFVLLRSANRQSESGSEKVRTLAPRLPAFAAANGWGYSESSYEPQYGGSLFASGFDRTALEHLWSPAGPRFGLGTYKYSLPGGDTDDVEHLGFVAVELAEPLPHLLLVAGRRRTTAAGLPFGVAAGQALTLGADLDRGYTLHGPAGFEAAASALFTARLLDLTADEMGRMHVEVVDGWLYVYSPRDFRGASADDYDRLLAVVEAARSDAAAAVAGFAGAPAHRLRPGRSARDRAFRVWNWMIPVSMVVIVGVPALASPLVDLL